MRLLIAAVGVLAFSASASAQYPYAPPPQATPITKHTAVGGYFTTNAAFGDPSHNNGSGSIWSDHAFVFGSSRSFFAPCGPAIFAPNCSTWFQRKPTTTSSAAKKCECETIQK